MRQRCASELPTGGQRPSLVIRTATVGGRQACAGRGAATGGRGKNELSRKTEERGLAGGGAMRESECFRGLGQIVAHWGRPWSPQP